MRVSVIIPAYNVAAYLPKALDSVIGQSFVDWEVVVVNDGSTDGTLEVAERYGAQDARIRVIDQPNAGVMAARSKGLSTAKGELIYFLDGDDYLVDTALESLYNCIEKGGADIVFGHYYRQSPSYTLKCMERCGNGVLQGDQYIKNILTNQITSYLCGRLYRRELFDGLDFNGKLSLSEDKYLNLQIALSGARIELCDSFIFYYVKRVESLTHSVMPLEYVKILTGSIEQLFVARKDLMPWVVAMKVSYYLTYINSTSTPDISGNQWVKQLHAQLREGANGELYRQIYGPWDRINVFLRRRKAGALPAKILITVRRISKSMAKRARKNG